jgi:hypothetical protein
MDRVTKFDEEWLYIAWVGVRNFVKPNLQHLGAMLFLLSIKCYMYWKTVLSECLNGYGVCIDIYKKLKEHDKWSYNISVTLNFHTF